MPIFAEYTGEDTALDGIITGFEHTYRLITSPTVAEHVKRRTINNTEAQLLSILRSAGRAGPYEERWLAANRQEIINVFREMDALREVLGTPRPPDLNHAEADLRQAYATAEAVYDDRVDHGAASTAAAMTALITGGAAASATGLSAFSFFGGPVVGATVTSVTAAVGATATGVSAAVRYQIVKHEAKAVAEQVVRDEFRPGQ